MNLHEYQSKKIFSEYGIAVPSGHVAATAEEAAAAERAVERIVKLYKAWEKPDRVREWSDKLGAGDK